MADELNIHGCAIILGNKGLLIRGPSGSGKSRTARLLIREFNRENRFARWVADDRVRLVALSDAIIAAVPDTIAGLAECRFAEIENVPFEKMARLDLVVDLLPADELERLPERKTTILSKDGPALPLINGPAYDAEQALEIILNQLRQNSRVI